MSKKKMKNNGAGGGPAAEGQGIRPPGTAPSSGGSAAPQGSVPLGGQSASGGSKAFFVVIGLAAVSFLLFIFIKSTAKPGLDRLTIFTSGHTVGYLENCGCSQGQTGGVQRRARILEVERAKALEVPKGGSADRVAEILIDTGDFSDPFEEEKRILSGCVVQMMGVLKYDAVGIGAKELGLRQKDLLALLQKAELPYIAANLEFTTPPKDADASAELRALVKPYQIITRGKGYRIGVIHILDPNQFSIGITKREGYEVTSADDAVTQILSQHKQEANLWLITASAMSRKTMDLTGLGGQKDVLLVFGFRADNPLEPENAVEVVFPKFVERNMEKGKDLLITKVYFPKEKGKAPTVDAIKTRVDDTYEAPESVMGILKDCKKQIEDWQFAHDQELLQHNNSAMMINVPRYMGWQSCQACHSDIAQQLAETKHYMAYETLHEQDKQLTTCMKCHSVGYMRPGGWNSVEERQFAGKEWDRRDVQCENCHGPGEWHIRAMAGEKIEKLSTDGRDKFGLLPATQSTCVTCHDEDNDPHFDFKTYWPKIAHHMTSRPAGKAKTADEVAVGEPEKSAHANGGGPHVPGMGPPEH
ncbi:hypothetical protein IT575_10790 [bacterium]|nr:hypothetical protein [bacterium]